MSTEWSAEEVAAVVVVLLPPMANYLVGEVVAVNSSLLMI